MIFTTQLFLFVFFPLCLILYVVLEYMEKFEILARYLRTYRLKDLLIIFFSLIFYMWAGVINGVRLLAYVIGIYILAFCIETYRAKKMYINVENDETFDKPRKFYLSIIPFTIAICLVIFYLAYYKYSGMLAYIWNFAFSDNMQLKSLYAPIGLSFITFSAISYLTDVYKGKATKGSFIDCALYLTFFPKVVSGPIVLWKDFQNQILSRKSTLDMNIEGINRIMIGFSKKLLLADVFGQVLAKIGTVGIDQITALSTLPLYMLQIYYDFSSYSDISIGLAKLFGFDFKENFNFPYRSKSITEFWRRWHISLGTWFREYVYIPLGGNRKGLVKTLRNLFIVFLLTGIWHGAGKTYILWGIINGLFVVLERVVSNKKVYQKTPEFVKYVFTMLIVMLFWQLFRFERISEVASMFGIIFGIVKFDRIFYTWKYYLNARIILFMLIGILGATILGNSRIQMQYQKFQSTKIGYVVQETVLILLFILSICFMINSTYSPFIYFQY